MKKILLFTLLVLTSGGFVMAEKSKKVIKTAYKKPVPQSKAKVSEVEAPPKKKTTDAFQAWLRDIKRRVTRTNAKPNQMVAVAAVRGDKASDAAPLYWKGKKAEGKVEVPEMKDFEAAIDTAINGDSVAAEQKLQAFVTTYPNSTLVSDANETLARLKSTETANP